MAIEYVAVINNAPLSRSHIFFVNIYEQTVNHHGNNDYTRVQTVLHHQWMLVRNQLRSYEKLF